MHPSKEFRSRQQHDPGFDRIAGTLFERPRRVRKIMTQKAPYHFLYYWFPVVVYCLVIFVQSSFPTPEQIPSFPHMDKLLHFSCYSVLGALFLRGFRNSKYKNKEGLIRAASIILTGLYGATDEGHQYFVLQRSAEVWDIFFDFLGGLAGVYIYVFILERYPKTGRI
jgi:VanZ family protein